LWYTLLLCVTAHEPDREYLGTGPHHRRVARQTLSELDGPSAAPG
jgi:hypothetical protein